MTIPKLLASGRLVDVANLKSEDISPWDIAYALKGSNRWGAHTTPYWSVLDHAVLCLVVGQSVAGIIRNEVALALLLHDADEAYFADLQWHLKEMPWAHEFRVLCNQALATVFECFKLIATEEDWSFVKKVDAYVGWLEMRQFWPEGGSQETTDRSAHHFPELNPDDFILGRMDAASFVNLLNCWSPYEVRNDNAFWRCPERIQAVLTK